MAAIISSDLWCSPELFDRFLALLTLFLLATRIDGQPVAAPQAGLDIEINVPAFRLVVRADTGIIRSFPVAVGMRRYPTPTGDYEITEVHWNPWWRPPDSPWAEKDTITPPGPRNPMGKVKMPLGRALLVHGTSQPASIGTAASHACIRLHNTDAVALAKLVQENAGANVPEGATDSLLRRWRPSRRIPLRSPVPVRIVYNLVELHGDTLAVYPDVYRRGRDTIEADALALLATAGYDTAAVDRDLVRSVAEKGARARTKVAIPRR